MDDFKYTGLHQHSVYSVLDGFAKVEEMVLRSKELGMVGCCISDHGSMASAYVLNKFCKKHGVKPIFANEMYIAPGSNLVKERLDDFKPSYHIIVIAKNNIGYKNLMRLTSDSYLKGKYYKARTSMSKLSEFKEGLIVTSACIGSYPAQMFLQGREEEAEDWIVEIHSIFGSDFYLEVQYSGLIEQEKVNKFYNRMSEKYNIEVIITSDSHYVKKEDSDYHQALVNIHIGGKITKKAISKSDSSSEKDQDETGMYYTPEEYFMKSGEDLMSSGKFNDFPEALSVTNKIAEQCNVDFITGGKFIPKIEDVYDDDFELREICNINLTNFIVNNNIDYENSIVYNKRLEYELEIIKKMEFSRYFLVVSEYVSWAKDNNIMVGGGRGSGAGSLVALITNITSIDPIRYGLLFERFLSRGRAKKPLIDFEEYTYEDYLKNKEL